MPPETPPPSAFGCRSDAVSVVATTDHDGESFEGEPLLPVRELIITLTGKRAGIDAVCVPALRRTSSCSESSNRRRIASSLTESTIRTVGCFRIDHRCSNGRPNRAQNSSRYSTSETD